jgi:UDP-N-acetylmuramoyl-L-alanyl-D-glutamate--2,6-diaminopimelate ligase
MPHTGSGDPDTEGEVEAGFMKLSRLLQGVPAYELIGDKDLNIQGIAYDSRRIKPGYMFVAIRGHELDGHLYMQDALDRGAVALVAEAFEDIPESVTRIRVSHSRDVLSKLAVRFYENPCENLRLIGITGTNGKTTTTYILESIIAVAKSVPGVIGTVNSRFPGKVYPAPVTTPESLDLMRIMRDMANHAVTHVIMEVSSHALDQGRTGDCPFNVAVFTNLSRDHLDYHRTMEAYFQTKSRLFQNLENEKHGRNAVAVINADDPMGKELTALIRAHVLLYGMNRDAHIRAESVSMDRRGITARLITPVGEREMRSPLLGMVNIYNCLAAAAAAIALDIGLHSVVAGIESLRSVPGRLEIVPNSRDIMVVVDYAHTPDALLKAIKTLRPITEGRLITVFGCGGDRDKGKRSEMGLAAGENSDIVLITSDNPRREDPESIVAQIEEGVRQTRLQKRQWAEDAIGSETGYFIEMDRRQAIKKALTMADKKDLVLIAGKGHEDYQIIGTEKRHFDDREEVARACQG